MSMGILLCCVIMWFCGTMPTGVVGVMACALIFLFGVQPSFEASFSGFSQPTVWFVLAVFCMTAFMQFSTLGLRLTRRFIKWGGCNSRRLVFAIMLVTAVCSAVMTDTGAVALSMSFAVPLLGAVGAKQGSNLGKCLLIGICTGACIGGFTTPCGHSLNVLAIGLMETLYDQQVGFLTWMCYGVPLAALVLPVAWLGLIKAFPPEPIAPEVVGGLMDDQFHVAPLSARDVKCLVVMVVMVALWVAGNWVPVLNATVVAVFGMLMLFVPGMGVVTWAEFERTVGWNLFLFFGGVMSLGAAIKATGAADFIASAFLGSGIMECPVLLSLVIISLFVYLLSTLLPISPAWVAIFLPPLMVYAQSVGVVALAPAFILCAVLAGSYLVPLCPSMSMAFGAGYFKFGDMGKSGWLPSLALVLGCALWVHLLGGVLGLA